MNVKKMLLLFCFFSYCYAGYSQNIEVEGKKKNEVEVSFIVLSTSNFALAKSIPPPEFGYSRCLGQYVKVGAFYSRVNYQTGLKLDNYGLKAGFLPLPLFVKNEEFKKLWELELSFNYVYEVSKYEDVNAIDTNSNRVFARLGISRKIYNNLYGFSNIGIWQKNVVSLGVRYKF
jgi:hypothetical protein